MLKMNILINPRFEMPLLDGRKIHTIRKRVKYHRQSRWLVFVNRSNRLILEPPKGGFCA
jgi:hypothetical protein